MKKNSKKTQNLVKDITFYGGVFLVVFVVILGIYLTQRPIVNKIDNELPKIEEREESFECLVRSNLDGVCSEQSEVGVIGVMIDNHHNAGTAAGINDASLVYEAIAEIPVTRYLVFFPSNIDVELIGPIRSARPYYVDWVSEFNGIYAHVGGSNEALSILKTRDILDMNEFAYGKYFWRSSKRVAPHNVFTSSENIKKAIDNYDWELPMDFESWIFKAEKEVSEDIEQVINIDYRNQVYDVKWEFDAKNNNYIRSQGGVLDYDYDGDLVTAKNVVVMYGDSEVIDDYGRRITQTLGTGEAVIFQDGVAIEGSWRRSSLSKRTRFYDKFSNEIQFNPGKTWVNVVPSHFPEVTYEN